MWLKRLITNSIEGYITSTQVIIILGPRQVGKSTLVKHLVEFPRQHMYLDLELKSDETKLEDPERYISENIEHIIVIDEVQRKPELFPLLRAIVDKYKKSRFILLGSASETMIINSSETLAGRSAYFELEPLNIWEVNDDQQKDLWFKGGYPKPFTAEKLSTAQDWTNHFIKSYIERELSTSYLKASSIQLEKFLEMISSLHGQLCNYSMIGNVLDLSVPTVKRYIDFFQTAFLLRVLVPYHFNIDKRLVKSPKLYIRDSGILHSLRGIDDYDQLQGSFLKGASWEGFVIQQIISVLKINVNPYFYRTADGAELDLILVKGIQVCIGFEIKYSNSPKVSPGIHRVINDLNIPLVLVVTPSSDEFPYKEKIRIAPLKNVIHHLRQLKLTEF